jgi:hypothetical protein
VEGREYRSLGENRGRKGNVFKGSHTRIVEDRLDGVPRENSTENHKKPGEAGV